MKKSLIFSIVALVVAVIVTVGSLLAWFTGGDAAYNIQFDIAVVDMRLALHRVNDFDLDGAVDLDNNLQAMLVEKPIFDTSNFTNEADIQNEMSKADDIINFMPTQVYTYRLDVYNHGDVDSYLNLHAQTNAPQGYIIEYRAYYSTEGQDGIAWAEIPVTALPAGYDGSTSLADETAGHYAPVPLKRVAGDVTQDDSSLELFIQIKFTLAEDYSGNGSSLPQGNYGTKFYVTIWA